MALTKSWIAFIVLGPLFVLGLLLDNWGFYRQLSYSEEHGLSAAVRHGDMAALKAALDSGVNPNHRMSGSGMSGQSDLIFVAVGSPSVEPLLYLIKAGADVNSVDPDDGATPLTDALVRHRCDSARVLLKAGADPDMTYEHARRAALGDLEGLSAREIFYLREKHIPRAFDSETDTACWKEVAELLGPKK